LILSELALKVDGEEKAIINLDICDVLYELNQFENSKAEMHNNMRIFIGNKRNSFVQRQLVVSFYLKIGHIHWEKMCFDPVLPINHRNLRHFDAITFIILSFVCK